MPRRRHYGPPGPHGHWDPPREVWRRWYFHWRLRRRIFSWMAVAMVRVRWLPRWGSVFVLVATALAVIPDQYAQAMWVTRGVALAQTDSAAYLDFERALFPLTAGWGVTLYDRCARVDLLLRTRRHLVARAHALVGAALDDDAHRSHGSAVAPRNQALAALGLDRERVRLHATASMVGSRDRRGPTTHTAHRARRPARYWARSNERHRRSRGRCIRQ